MAPDERYFVGVPIENKEAILQSGYRASRGKIRASKTCHDALLAFERCHSRVPACVSFVPPGHARIMEMDRGVHVDCSFLPADSLQDEVPQKDTGQQPNHIYVFWAVAEDEVERILQQGYQPKHRRSIPVALDINDAERAFRSKRLGIPCVIRISLQVANARGFHAFEHDRGVSLHMPFTAEKVYPNILELAEVTPPATDVSDGTSPVDSESEAAEHAEADVGSEEEPVPDSMEFPHMKQGRFMWIHVKSGEGSDQSRWAPGRIVQGGTSRAEVCIQIKSGRLNIAEQLLLADSRVLDFHHPDACQLPDLEILQEAQVQALHRALSPGGSLPANLQDIFSDPPPVESLKVGTTTLQKIFIVQQGQVPENGKAAFFRELEASLKRPPEDVRSAANAQILEIPRIPDIGDKVRCFAVFQCQAERPCSIGDSALHFDVRPTADGRADDARPGHYHLWDTCNGKDVYKKYGSEMYLYMCHGQDLTIGNLHFDMYNMKDYTHAEAPVLKARDVDLYLFYEWYKHSTIKLGQGRWILGEKVLTCPLDATLEMSEYFAMTEIREVDTWPPWPHNDESLRFNGKCRERIEDYFAQQGGLMTWPLIRIRRGQYRWAFGRDPAGQDHIETMVGNYMGTIPRHGWHGMEIVWPEARRFASSVQMAKMCADGRFMNLQDNSKVPTKGCLGKGGTCHFQSDAIFIEPYDPLNPEHQMLGDHKFRECMECFRFGDRCSKLARERLDWNQSDVPRSSCHAHSDRGVDAWMRGRSFRPTEGGLETTVTFKGIHVSVLCYPDIFALEKSVWELGQKALRRGNNRSVFDTAFKLLNDRTLQGNPDSLAHVLLLLGHATRPAPTGLWQETTAARAATSAAVFEILKATLDSDLGRQRQHTQQKNAIAEVLKDQFGFSSQPKTGDPHGWVTFALRKPTGWSGTAADECFHGTAMTAMAPILLEGLKQPRSRDESAHGQRGSTSRKSIYLSPSWHYAAHPVYSPLHLMELEQKGAFQMDQMSAFQMVFKCEVLQGQYRTQNGTLGNKHWPRTLRIDPDRDTLDNLEYLVEDEGVVRVKEVMFRKFGRDSDPNKFGPLPPRLRVDAEPGLEYRWTKLLQNDFIARNLYTRQ